MQPLVALIAASSLLIAPAFGDGVGIIIYHTNTESVRDVVVIRAQQAGCQYAGKTQAGGSVTGWLVVVTSCPRLPDSTPEAEIIGYLD
jgi:hypothetical protein